LLASLRRSIVFEVGESPGRFWGHSRNLCGGFRSAFKEGVSIPAGGFVSSGDDRDFSDEYFTADLGQRTEQ
jgi:hypothetical protein